MPSFDISVDMICVSRLFFESNLLDIYGTNDPKCLGWYLWNVLEIKNEEEGRKTRWGILES